MTCTEVQGLFLDFLKLQGLFNTLRTMINKVCKVCLGS